MSERQQTLSCRSPRSGAASLYLLTLWTHPAPTSRAPYRAYRPKGLSLTWRLVSVLPGHTHWLAGMAQGLTAATAGVGAHGGTANGPPSSPPSIQVKRISLLPVPRPQTPPLSTQVRNRLLLLPNHPSTPFALKPWTLLPLDIWGRATCFIHHPIFPPSPVRLSPHCLFWRRSPSRQTPPPRFPFLRLLQASTSKASSQPSAHATG